MPAPDGGWGRNNVPTVVSESIIDALKEEQWEQLSNFERVQHLRVEFLPYSARDELHNDEGPVPEFIEYLRFIVGLEGSEEVSQEDEEGEEGEEERLLRQQDRGCGGPGSGAS
jgi:uncharacterized protein YfbU (UPF0304 family)